MSVVRISRRKRLLGYMVLQPVASCQMGYPAAHTSSDEEVGHAQGPFFLSLRWRLDPSLGAGPSPCIHVLSAAWILQTLLTKARTAPVFMVPIPAADAAQQVTQFRPWPGTPVGCGASR